MQRSGKKRKKVEKRFTNAEVLQLEKQIYDYVESTKPVTVRHVFYRMTDPTLPVHVEKTLSEYEKIRYRMSEMRTKGTMPYAWISDMTRKWVLYVNLDIQVRFPSTNCVFVQAQRMGGSL